jgi:hypothetical protein
MDRKLRVLLLVAEPWRHDDGGGNTLNNFFEGMDAEFAQVYSSGKMPMNNVCKKYFQITDTEAVKSFLTKKTVFLHNLITKTCNTRHISKKQTFFHHIKTGLSERSKSNGLRMEERRNQNNTTRNNLRTIPLPLRKRRNA